MISRLWTAAALLVALLALMECGARAQTVVDGVHRHVCQPAWDWRRDHQAEERR